MTDSNENDISAGWVRGDLPEEAEAAPLGQEAREAAGRTTNDEGRTPLIDDEPLAAEGDKQVQMPASEPLLEPLTELGVGEVDPLVEAEMQGMMSDLAALVEPTFVATSDGVQETTMNLVATEPPDEVAEGSQEPQAVAAAVEATLQEEELATYEAETAPVIDDAAPEVAVPVTSEAELGVEISAVSLGEAIDSETSPPAEALAEMDTNEAEAQEPALETERPNEVDTAPAGETLADESVGEPAEAEAAAEELSAVPVVAEAAPVEDVPPVAVPTAPEKPKKRGKKARVAEPVPSAALAVDGLSQAEAASYTPTTIGPAVASGPLSLAALVESLLFVADGAVPVARLAEALEIHPREVEAALAALAESYQDRGLSLQRFRDRVQLTTSPTAAPMVERFLGLAASTPLSRAALEALAIIAYQQPVTRPQIEAVRGVNSDSVIKNLLTKGLIEESGRAEGPGRPVLYSTTTEFMQHFGLAALTDLPPLTPPTAETPGDTISELLKG